MDNLGKERQGNDMMKNMTPHVLRIFDAEGVTLLAEIPPSGQVARVAVSRGAAGSHDGLPLFRTVTGVPEGLPAPVAGVTYIVSLVVRQALPERGDLASPGQLIRGDDGQPVGCRGLDV